MTSAVPLPASISTLDPLSPTELNDRLLDLLGQRILSSGAGAHLAALTRLAGQPQQHLWLGQLASEPLILAETAAGRNPGLIPPAQGFALRLPSLPATFDLQLSFCVYVALHPTVDEQRAHHDDSDPATAATCMTGPATLPTQQGGQNDQTGQAPAAGGSAVAGAVGGVRVAGKQLATVWTKVPVGPINVTVTIPAGAHGSYRTAENEITIAIDDALRRVNAARGLELYRPRQQAQPAGSLPRPDDMVDDRTWAAYTATNLLDPIEVVPPRFAAAMEVDAIADGSCTELLLTVVNRTPEPDAQYADLTSTTPYDRHHVDTRLYEVNLQATTASPLAAYQLEQVAQSYRYDRSVRSFGHNSPVEVTGATGGSSGAALTTLATTFGAEIRTWRVHSRTSALGGSVLDTRFATVAADPIAALRAIGSAHEAWVKSSWSPSELAKLASAHGWSAQAQADAAAAATEARDEVTWIADGLKQLPADPQLLEAFTLMNAVMCEVGKRKNYHAWRPFQLAWIVGCLPALVDPVAHPAVNIVWFATGGGKSEAYLGLMLVELFYSRLTGTTAGSTVWARFPLRLLALQQTERFAEVVLLAEQNRRAHPSLAAADPFGVGFFVGSGNTPNRIYDLNSAYGNGMDPTGPELAEKCRVLEFCPVCDPHRTGNRVVVVFNRSRWSMEHLCTNGSCPAHGALPVWTIDDDIYRNAPSVLVGTVDKLAQLAQASHFAVLLGQAHSRCPAHGYTANPLFCAVFGCTATRALLPPGFTGVRLEIADELHLLDESLGALDGMYETLLQAISGALGNRPMTIVGATATLEGYENQVKHLYQRPARRFPASGPQAGENFWAYTKDGDPMRRYLGVRPRGITMVTAAREVALLHHQWLRDLVTNPAAVAAEGRLPTDAATLDHLSAIATDLYQVLLAYCLRKEDLSSFTRDDKIVELLSTSRNLAVIGGDANPADIREAVARLGKPPADPNEQVRIIAATKAIGHGFDSPRLGVMALMGTPTQAAEVIQATARVGRTHPGLVVHLFNPSRDRDASVFRYYTSWVSYLDRLVHKVPVNRESLPVLRRVLSGALMAWLLMVHDRTWLTGGARRKSLGDSGALKDALVTGTVDRTLLIAELNDGLGLDPARVYHKLHREAVERYIDDTLLALNVSGQAGKRTGELLDPPVPRSLRDVEEPIRVYGDI
jgi:hypothetical protein